MEKKIEKKNDDWIALHWEEPKDGKEAYVILDGLVYTKSEIISLLESGGYTKAHAELIAEKRWFSLFVHMQKRFYNMSVIKNLKENGRNKWHIPEDGSAPYMEVQGRKVTYLEMISYLREIGFRIQLAIEEVENGRFEEAAYEQYERICVDPIGSYRKAMAALY